MRGIKKGVLVFFLVAGLSGPNSARAFFGELFSGGPGDDSEVVHIAIQGIDEKPGYYWQGDIFGSLDIHIPLKKDGDFQTGPQGRFVVYYPVCKQWRRIEPKTATDGTPAKRPHPGVKMKCAYRLVEKFFAGLNGRVYHLYDQNGEKVFNYSSMRGEIKKTPVSIGKRLLSRWRVISKHEYPTDGW